MDYLLHGGKAFDKVVFTSPLIRSFLWAPSQSAFGAIKPILSSIYMPRFPGFSTTDRELADRMKVDPIMSWTLECHWVSALFEWNKINVNYPKCDGSILLLQSQNDVVVDRDYNTLYLTKRFKNVEYHLIKNSKHLMLNESAVIRQEAFSHIGRYLTGNKSENVTK